MVAVEAPPERKLISRGKFQERLGCGRTFFYKLSETDERFPRPVRLGAKLLYVASEVEDYLATLANDR